MNFFTDQKKTYILFLANVFPEDCPAEDDIISSITEDVETLLEDDEIPEKIYDALPKYFINLESWPKSINRLCCSCSNSVLGIPWTIPIGKIKKLFLNQNSVLVEISDTLDPKESFTENIHVVTKEISVLKTHNCYCSPFCVVRYIKHVNDPKIINKWESIKLLNLLFYKIIGKEVKSIPEAADPMIQVQYSGPSGITSRKYQENIEALWNNWY